MSPAGARISGRRFIIVKEYSANPVRTATAGKPTAAILILIMVVDFGIQIGIAIGIEFLAFSSISVPIPIWIPIAAVIIRIAGRYKMPIDSSR